MIDPYRHRVRLNDGTTICVDHMPDGRIVLSASDGTIHDYYPDVTERPMLSTASSNMWNNIESVMTHVSRNMVTRPDIAPSIILALGDGGEEIEEPLLLMIKSLSPLQLVRLTDSLLNAVIGAYI